MTNKTAALRYARALLDVAVKEKADLERIERDLQEFVDLLRAYPALEKVLLNPAVPVTRKRPAVEDLMARAKFSPILSKLLVMLAERDRLVLLPDVLASYRDRLMDYRQIARAEVTTATPLDPKKLQAIQAGLAKATGRTVDVTAKVDPAIIGGMVARVGSTVYDASVAHQLVRMKDSLENL